MDHNDPPRTIPGRHSVRISRDSLRQRSFVRRTAFAAWCILIGTVVVVFLLVDRRSESGDVGLQVDSRPSSAIPSSGPIRRTYVDATGTNESAANLGTTMPSTGTLRLTFVDEDGGPVQGFKAGLVFGRNQQPASSDENGQCVFTVQPGVYRWRNVSGRSCRILPPPDEVIPSPVDQVRDGTGWSLVDSFDDGLTSGKFDIVAGSETVFRVTVWSRVRVTGLIEVNAEESAGGFPTADRRISRVPQTTRVHAPWRSRRLRISSASGALQFGLPSLGGVEFALEAENAGVVEEGGFGAAGIRAEGFAHDVEGVFGDLFGFFKFLLAGQRQRDDVGVFVGLPRLGAPERFAKGE